MYGHVCKRQLELHYKQCLQNGVIWRPMEIINENLSTCGRYGSSQRVPLADINILEEVFFLTELDQ